MKDNSVGNTNEGAAQTVVREVSARAAEPQHKGE